MYFLLDNEIDPTKKSLILVTSGKISTEKLILEETNLEGKSDPPILVLRAMVWLEP